MYLITSLKTLLILTLTSTTTITLAAPAPSTNELNTAPIDTLSKRQEPYPGYNDCVAEVTKWGRPATDCRGGYQYTY